MAPNRPSNQGMLPDVVIISSEAEKSTFSKLVFFNGICEHPLCQLTSTAKVLVSCPDTFRIET